MRGSGHPLRHVWIAAIVIAVSAGLALAADPVTVAVTVSGDPAPGATVTAKATITINDGSRLLGVKWTQTGGPQATLSGTTTETITAVMPSRQAFKEALLHALREAPVAAGKLPDYVPAPHFESGLQDRFGIVGISPFAREEGGALAFDVAVTTTTGTYHLPAAIHAHLPWPTAIATRNVPVGVPVLLYGKTQSAYDWMLLKPAGSAALLVDGATQSPEFVPDLPGTYEIRVTDQAAAKSVTLAIHAGKWQGVVTGISASGEPIADPACKTCHVPSTPHFDLFTPWERSGHAEIFQQNVDNPQGHYSESCVSCHTVGYDTASANGGIDEASDWTAFLGSGMLTHGAIGNFDRILQQFPQTARMTGIQCENCHGPQDSVAHMKKDGSRKTQSSDLCGTCHGEPLRHGRYQQWQLSLHANYEVAGSEGTRTGCSQCHSSQGFIAWANSNFTKVPTATWTADEVHPVTCVACHDPHAVGTTSGGPATNATVRIAGSTPMLDAGFKADGVGRGAICMTCHNGRRGLRDDQHFNTADLSRAPHVGPQADVVMGRNLYFVPVGQAGNHATIEDSCVTCHMESTPPPADLSYNYGGTNHTFFAKADICAKCHTSITLESVQAPIEAKLHDLEHEIELALKATMQAQMRLGNRIDIGGTVISSPNEIAAVDFIESHGRQGISATLASGAHIEDIALNSVKVIRPGRATIELYAAADPSLAKAGWNYFVVHSDKSHGVHNPAFVNSALDVALFAVRSINAAAAAPGVGPGADKPWIAGGPGQNQGAVACATPFVYWSEIAGHMPGAEGSQWRTDLVVRNLASSAANLRFVLHDWNGNLEGTGAVGARSQRAFEDIVATLGATNKFGALEICSDQPLLVASRVFNASPMGSYGQGLDGHVADLGYGPGETVSLIGLRQKTGMFRTNISVTNGGKTAAKVTVKLFDAAGAELTSYPLEIPAGLVVQDLAPFAARANAPDLDWGFATVTVVEGTNVRTSASVVDMKTNDPTAVPAKQ